MNLKDYLIKYRLSAIKFSKQNFINRAIIYRTVNQEQTPNLLTALEILIATNGEIRLEKLLDSRDRKKLNEFLKTHNKERFGLPMKNMNLYHRITKGFAPYRYLQENLPLIPSRISKVTSDKKSDVVDKTKPSI